MIKHWTSNHPLPKIWEKLLMLLITRCIPPAMLGLGRAKKLELFNFDLHDFSSPSCLPCEKITNNKSSQTLQKDSSSLKRTNKNAREKEIYIYIILVAGGFDSGFGFLGWLVVPRATLASEVQPMENGRTTNLSARSFIIPS